MKPTRKNKRGDTARANGAALKALRQIGAMRLLIRETSKRIGHAPFDDAARRAEDAIRALCIALERLAEAGHAPEPEHRARMWERYSEGRRFVDVAVAHAFDAYHRAIGLKREL